MHLDFNNYHYWKAKENKAANKENKNFSNTQ
jgi:hypothetical protein